MNVGGLCLVSRWTRCLVKTFQAKQETSGCTMAQWYLHIAGAINKKSLFKLKLKSLLFKYLYHVQLTLLSSDLPKHS
jgi:hypothetical protein